MDRPLHVALTGHRVWTAEFFRAGERGCFRVGDSTAHAPRRKPVPGATVVSAGREAVLVAAVCAVRPVDDVVEDAACTAIMSTR